MMIKYRVSDVAKDFGVTSKVIVELLAKYVQPAKKSATALEESELDIIFEHYTQKHNMDNLDAYFATASERVEHWIAYSVEDTHRGSRNESTAEIYSVGGRAHETREISYSNA